MSLSLFKHPANIIISQHVYTMSGKNLSTATLLSTN